MLTTAQRADQILRDNFQRWRPEDTHVRKNSAGETLYEVLCDDVVKKEGNASFCIGGSYYKGLKHGWAPSHDPRKLLNPPNPPEPVPAALMKAAIASKRANPEH